MLLCPAKAERNTGNDLVSLVAVNGARFGRAEKWELALVTAALTE